MLTATRLATSIARSIEPPKVEACGSPPRPVPRYWPLNQKNMPSREIDGQGANKVAQLPPWLELRG